MEDISLCFGLNNVDSINKVFSPRNARSFLDYYSSFPSRRNKMLKDIRDSRFCPCIVIRYGGMNVSYNLRHILSFVGMGVRHVIALPVSTWYTGGMITRDGFTYRNVRFYGENLVHFYSGGMVVDDIESSRLNHNGMDASYAGMMFSLKLDGDDDETVYLDDDGFMDSGDAFWNSPCMPVPHKEGDIDEEIYIYYGLILGPGSADYEYYKNALAEMKKNGNHEG